MLQTVMRKRLILVDLLILVTTFCVVVPLAWGHEHDTFKIGDRYYLFTIGSLNEPFVVDDTSGVDLRVTQLPGPPSDGARAAGK